MSSVREQIAEDRMKTARQMTEGAGYNFDWMSFYDGLAPLEPNDVPAFQYTDPTDEMDEVVLPMHDRTLFVEFKGTHFVPDPDEQYPVGRRMIADLERNIKVDITLGGVAVDIKILRSEIFAGRPVTDRVTAVVACDIRYRTHMNDPNQAK